MVYKGFTKSHSGVMNEDVVTAREPLSFAEALETLKKSKVGKLLILDKEDRLVSMVTRSDLKKVRDYPGRENMT